MRRAERLFQIVQIIGASQWTTAQALAERLEEPYPGHHKTAEEHITGFVYEAELVERTGEAACCAFSGTPFVVEICNKAQPATCQRSPRNEKQLVV